MILLGIANIILRLMICSLVFIPIHFFREKAGSDSYTWCIEVSGYKGLVCDAL